MEPLNRKELFKKTKCCLAGKVMFLILFLIFIGLLIFCIIIQDKLSVYLGVTAVLFLFIMLIWNKTIPYFLDLICLEYKITDLVIENKANGGIQGRDRLDIIGGDRKITCIDGKKLNLIIYHKINEQIPNPKSEDQYKLVYLKYSKIIIDSIIISPEAPKNGKKYKKRR